MRKPKPTVSAWIIRERKRLGLKPIDLARRLTAMGLPTADGTPRTWEAGRSPSPDNIEGLERIFGSASPEAAPDADQAALIGALAAQTEAITALVLELQLSRAAQIEATSVALEALGALGVRRDPQGTLRDSEPGAHAGTGQ